MEGERCLSCGLLVVLLLVALQPREARALVLTPRPDSGQSHILIQGQLLDIRCLCFEESDDPVDVDFVWIGYKKAELARVSGCTTVQYRVEAVQLSDAGQYSCNAKFTDGSSINPVLPGNITVLDDTAINAPSMQYALLGTSTTLICSHSLPTDIDVLRTWRNSSDLTQTIGNDDGELSFSDVSLGDQGTYVCDIYSEQYSLMTNVEFVVIVPPRIILEPPSSQTIAAAPQALTVTFESQLQENTTVTWFKGESPLSQTRYNTVFSSLNRTHGTTELTFDSVTRSDRGTYRVVVESSLTIIPEEQRRTESTFVIGVVIPPSLPNNIRIVNVNSTTVRVSWELTNQTADTGADRFTLVLTSQEETATTESYIFLGVVTTANISVNPGQEYQLQLTASNVDGETKSALIPFITDPDTPSISAVSTERLNFTAYQLTIMVAYTGGGAITELTVSFRSSSDTVWNSLGSFPAFHVTDSSYRQWRTVMVSDKFSSVGPLQFLVSATNEKNVDPADAMEALETTVLPGPPSTPTLLNSTTSCLTVQLSLPPSSVAPLTAVHISFTDHPDLSRNFTKSNRSSRYEAGEVITLKLDGLSGGVAYNFVAHTASYAGRGHPSEEVTFSTNSLPLPQWIMIVIAVAVGVAVVIIVVVCILCLVKCRRVRLQKQEYYIGPKSTSVEEKRLESTNPLVNRHRSNHSIETFGSSPTVTRPSTTSTDVSNSPPANVNTKYRWFETGSSSGGSNHSEETDINCPRYMYRVSPSPPSSGPPSNSLPNLHHPRPAPVGQLAPPTVRSVHSTRESLIYPQPSHEVTDV